MLVATRTAVRTIGKVSFGSGTPGGGHFALSKRRKKYVPTSVPNSVASVATKTAIPHQPFGRASLGSALYAKLFTPPPAPSSARLRERAGRAARRLPPRRS